VVGTGAFGNVFEGRDKNNKRVAIKRVRRHSTQLGREMEFMASIAHPNIVAMSDTFFTRTLLKSEWVIHHNLVFEYMPMNLLEFIKFRWSIAKAAITVDEVKTIVRQCLEALRFIHEVRKPPLMHRRVINHVNAIFPSQVHF
jgi:serine/threonine protein kinase